MPNRKAIIFSMILATGLVMAVLSLPYLDHSGNVHKMMMPNRYKIFLAEDDYRIVHIIKWREKNFESEGQPLDLTITDGGAKSLLPEWTVAGRDKDFEALGSENGPEGSVEFYIKVPKAGWYYVNSDQKSIVAIVPSSEIYIANSSWTAFTGCQNFWDFEEPLRTAQ